MKKHIRKIIFILSGLLALHIIGLVVYCLIVNRFIDEHKDLATKADVAVVFCGSCNSGKVGEDTIDRMEHAIVLYRNDKISNVICVGGNRKNINTYASALMREFMIKNGIPEARITNDTLSYNTHKNWEEAEKIIRKNNFRSIVVVSSPFHIYRISKIIGREGIHYSTYNYEISSFVDYITIYKHILHEWAAFSISFLLTESTYDTLMRWYKGIK